MNNHNNLVGNKLDFYGSFKHNSVPEFEGCAQPRLILWNTHSFQMDVFNLKKNKKKFLNKHPLAHISQTLKNFTQQTFSKTHTLPVPGEQFNWKISQAVPWNCKEHVNYTIPTLLRFKTWILHTTPRGLRLLPKFNQKLCAIRQQIWKCCR